MSDPGANGSSHDEESAHLRRLLQVAKSGERQSFDELLARCRPLLRIMCVEAFRRDAVGARVDASDVVQETCLSAWRAFERFRGSSMPQFLAWLQSILEANSIDAIRRHQGAAKRAVERERALDVQLSHADESQQTPSALAMRGERAILLAEAIAELPVEQGLAVRKRHLEGKSLAEIAAEMDRSQVAAASLIKRGLKALKQRIRE